MAAQYGIFGFDGPLVGSTKRTGDYLVASSHRETFSTFLL
jgi:hypothetical protein